jgi:hypothetical protein
MERLGGAGLRGLAPQGGKAVHARADDLLQLRVRVRAPRLRGPGDPADPEVRGESGTPRLPWEELRQGPGHPQPDHGPRPDPLSSQAGWEARGGKVDPGQLGRGSGGAGWPHPRGNPGRPTPGDHVSRGPSGRGRLRGAHARSVGSRRTQLPHQHLLQRGAGRISLLDGLRSAQPRSRQRQRDPACQQPSGGGSLLQPPRAARDRREAEGREAHRAGHSPVQHGHSRRLLAIALPGIRARHLPGHRELPCAEGAL